MDAEKDNQALVHLFRYLDPKANPPSPQELLDDPYSIALFLRKIRPKGETEHQEIVGLVILTRIFDSGKGIISTMALQSRYEGYHIEKIMMESVVTISQNLGIKTLEILINPHQKELRNALRVSGLTLEYEQELYRYSL
ncbi:MAG: hypothetical protein A2756_00580 [Candidatus Ryanbacteria bacterium RIFCSPHIGHO2_01_FULL_48_27]|uniref:N-acetyltransferase domain-containing protein n=1 Tax=Candidatus Ryanbacteria bacterium RIFCSPHIGHO2_01_FULL_48_27 TaxID=1802115 RepID=A0A1G2G6A2_9BACT|nr:MAG: hypothetical protein A2756_00580 [Candidatus Ryanbacteria bacterium RIFCSPHIGHO2_01_FULL_48_27]